MPARRFAASLIAALLSSLAAGASERNAVQPRELTPAERHELRRIQLDAQRRRAAAPTEEELAARLAPVRVPRAALPSVRTIQASDPNGHRLDSYSAGDTDCEFKPVMTDDDLRRCTPGIQETAHPRP